MRRKRFKHQAYILCHMFRGWQLYPDYDFLVKHGSGVLEIDVLSGRCLCNGEPAPTLSIAMTLLSWLKEDLAQHSVPLDSIDEAFLKVNFRVFEQATRNPMKTVSGSFECFSRLRSGSDVYESQLTDRQSVYVKR